MVAADVEVGSRSSIHCHTLGQKRDITICSRCPFFLVPFELRSIQNLSSVWSVAFTLPMRQSKGYIYICCCTGVIKSRRATYPRY